MLANLDGEADQHVDGAWLREVEIRARAAIMNPEDDLAWEPVRAELHADPPHDQTRSARELGAAELLEAVRW